MNNHLKSENTETTTVYVVIAEMGREGCIYEICPSLEKAMAIVEYIFSWESPFRNDTIFIDKHFINYRKYKINSERWRSIYGKYMTTYNGYLSAYIIDTKNSDSLIEDFIKDREFPAMLFLED